MQALVSRCIHLRARKMRPPISRSRCSKQKLQITLCFLVVCVRRSMHSFPSSEKATTRDRLTSPPRIHFSTHSSCKSRTHAKTLPSNIYHEKTCLTRRKARNTTEAKVKDQRSRNIPGANYYVLTPCETSNGNKLDAIRAASHARWPDEKQKVSLNV